MLIGAITLSLPAKCRHSSWGSPSPEFLSFPSCTEPIHLWRLYISESTDTYLVSYPQKSFEGANPIVSLLSGLEYYLQANQLVQTPDEEVWQWLLDHRVRERISHIASWQCKNFLCPYVEWEGNADIAGIGVGIENLHRGLC